MANPLHLISKRPRMAVALVALMAAGYGYNFYAHDAAADPAAASAAPPPPEVTVKTLAEQPVQVWSTFSGRLHAVDQADIRPEVSGRITVVKFQDGQNVKAGDVLMVIDPRPYEAAVARAEANLATAQTNAKFAKLEQDRAAGMIANQAIAQRIFDERSNSNRVALAAVKAAEAELKQAQIDLEHANILAPISGKVSRAELTVGNVVQAGANAPLLTSIVSNQFIYADFEVDEQTYLESIRDTTAGADQDHKIAVEMTLPGDKDHIYRGQIDSFDNRLDVGSGTIRARAKFANTGGALVPGMFVSVKLANAGRYP